MPSLTGVLQSLEHPLMAQRLIQRPPHYFARIQIEENRQIQPALSRPYVGDITNPGLVGVSGLEIALQPIGSHRKGVVRVRRLAKSTPDDRAQSQCAHPSSHSIFSYRPTFFPQRTRDFGAARALFANLKKAFDRPIETTRFSSSGAFSTPFPRIIPTGRHLQDSAHLLNTPQSAVLVDETIASHYPFSEKMTTAFFKISRSRRSRSFSRRRSRSSTSLGRTWPVPGKASSSSSRNWRFQREIMPLLIPKRRSTSDAFIPASEAMPIASNLNARSNPLCAINTPPESKVNRLLGVSTGMGEIQL